MLASGPVTSSYFGIKGKNTSEPLQQQVAIACDADKQKTASGQCFNVRPQVSRQCQFIGSLRRPTCFEGKMWGRSFILFLRYSFSQTFTPHHRINTSIEQFVIFTDRTGIFFLI